MGWRNAQIVYRDSWQGSLAGSKLSDESGAGLHAQRCPEKRTVKAVTFESRFRTSDLLLPLAMCLDQEVTTYLFGSSWAGGEHLSKLCLQPFQP